MGIRQRLLNEGFRVRLRTLKEIKELSILLNLLNYKWWSNDSLMTFTPSPRERGDLVYVIEPYSRSHYVGLTNSESCRKAGRIFYEYKEIFEDKFLYKEV